MLKLVAVCLHPNSVCQTSGSLRPINSLSEKLINCSWESMKPSSSSFSKRSQSEKNNLEVSKHLVTLHQRLYQALNLGIKYHGKAGKIWQCTDIEIQRLAVRSISAFVACLSPVLLQHPLVKSSVDDMVVALEGITQARNEAVLETAANVTVKLVDILGNFISLHHVTKLVASFSCLLSFPQSSVAASCAVPLDRILSKLIPKRHKIRNEVWEILKERKAVDYIVFSLDDFISGCIPYEHFKEMASLLKTILWRWAPSRYPVWSNANLLEGLEALCRKHDHSVEVVLHLYSAIVLCGSGAKKLLQNPETLYSVILHSMDGSQPYSLRVEAFKLAQLLVRSEQWCLAMMSQCCESIVHAIVNAMSMWSLSSGKVAANQMSLLLEACRFLALITRWGGDHHIYFWKLGIDRVLLGLLHGNHHRTEQTEISLSWDKLIATARKGLDTNFLTVLRPYIWAILGWLATHCGEDFNPDMHGNKHHLNLLITSGCLTLMESIKGHRVRHNNVPGASKLEPACKVVLLMVHSPCKYIASQASLILSELESSNVELYLEDFLDTLNSTGSTYMVDNDQTVINMIGLACFSVLPNYRSFIIERGGIKILSTFIGCCLRNDVNIACDSHYTSDGSSCCSTGSDNWEGGNSILLFSLCGLAELMHYSKFTRNHGQLILCSVAGCVLLGGSDAQILFDRLQKISDNTSNSHGLRWYAAYVMSFFGVYGFPSRLGKRLEKALHEKELTDVKLELPTRDPFRVHGVILMVRSPSMFPYRELPTNHERGDKSAIVEDTEQFYRNFQREVRLSARVDCQALEKLLEFVYTGIIEVDETLVKRLKMLAKGSSMHLLLHMLGRKHPKWGSTVPCCDLTLALGPAGQHFCDVIVEAKADEMDWTCSQCSSSLPHMHVHKIILCLSSEYIRALFQSGMQESHALSIKAPVGWEALSKLVSWFYSHELPKPSSGCIWDNMNVEEHLKEMHPYMELCWLAQFWFLDDIREAALGILVSCLNSSKILGLKIIQSAANLSQWDIVELAANCIAPQYPQLRASGDLESLDEEIVDMVRVTYVRLSQAIDHNYSK